MKTGEIIKKLVNAENYALERSKISDDFIDFLRDHMKRDFELIEEKENAYQDLLKLLS